MLVYVYRNGEIGVSANSKHPVGTLPLIANIDAREVEKVKSWCLKMGKTWLAPGIRAELSDEIAYANLTKLQNFLAGKVQQYQPKKVVGRL